MATPTRTVLFRREEEPWSAFLKRIQKSVGDVLLIFTPQDHLSLQAHEKDRKMFFYECGTLKDRLMVATKQPQIAEECRRQNVEVVDRLSAVRQLLKDNSQLDEAVRLFSPHLWSQQLRTRLQSIGLLSLPKLRIWVLIGTSVLLFLFVVLRLLPSAEVRIWPRQDSVNQTVNIYLTQSGAQLQVSPLARHAPLIPIKVSTKRTITFDQITQQFTGTPSHVRMKIINTTRDSVSIRKDSRLVNAQGLVFRLQNSAVLTASGTAMVNAIAEDTDQYGEIIGARGNVPAGTQWYFPALGSDQKDIIYAKNQQPATGGTTSSRLVLQQKDIDTARKKLEQDLLQTARQMVDDQVADYNRTHPGHSLRVFTEDDDKDLMHIYYHDFVLPTQFLGQTVTSVPVEGALDYKVVAFDINDVLGMLRNDLSAHIETGKALLDDSVTLDRLKFTIINFADDLTWVKGTADLTGSEQFLLDPLTPTGANFAKKVRELIVGLHRTDAVKIIRNLPEVEKVEIALWPPWTGKITTIPSNISIVQE